MSVGNAAKSAGLYLSKHSPKILTGLSVVGVVTTTVMAVKATPGVIDTLRAEAADLERELTPKEIVALSWKSYIPATSMGMATIACVLGANAVNTKRNAVIASAYSLTQNAFQEYKHQVIETFGESEAKKVNENLAKKRINDDPPTTETIIIAGAGDSLFRDSLSSRYFTTNIESVRKAINDINYQINSEGYASLNEFYNLIGLEETALGEELGWRSDNQLEVDFYPVMATDGRPCIELQYPKSPNREYYRFG